MALKSHIPRSDLITAAKLIRESTIKLSNAVVLVSISDVYELLSTEIRQINQSILNELGMRDVSGEPQ
jgi:hypothetical protein